MRFGHWNHPIQALPAYRSDYALADGVGKPSTARDPADSADFFEVTFNGAPMNRQVEVLPDPLDQGGSVQRWLVGPFLFDEVHHLIGDLVGP